MFYIKENNFFLLFHILMPYNILFYFRLPYFHVSNSAFFHIVLKYTHFI